MIEQADLKAAVSAGILTEAQAVSLQALAQNRKSERAVLRPSDEPFELFRGFNEIFIVVGLGVLTAGWAAFVGISAASEITNPQRAALLYGPIGAAVIWALSEYFIRARRMVAPAITLALLFSANAVTWSVIYFAEPFMVAQENFESLPLPIAVATALVAVHWLRFRVPFSVAIIALGLFGVALLIAAIEEGSPEGFADLFQLSATGPFAWITLALGGAVFVAAMAFDMSDPYRVTRRSANGFWLHVIAAPALINTLALSLLAQDTAQANGLLLAIMALFGVIAIVIDRRSFLIAAIGYIVVLAMTVFGGEAAATTILALGLVLLGLGAYWERIRARLMAMLPFLPAHKLPPFTLNRD
ncbi:MAG: hypothetical protein AAF943_10055 [Pseudomonadota bacterium]